MIRTVLSTNPTARKRERCSPGGTFAKLMHTTSADISFLSVYSLSCPDCKERNHNGKTIKQMMKIQVITHDKKMITNIPGPSQSRPVLLQSKQWPPASDWQHIGRLSSSLESSIHSLSYPHGCDGSHRDRPLPSKWNKTQSNEKIIEHFISIMVLSICWAKTHIRVQFNK